MSKYKARKTVINGIVFDSKKEGGRFLELSRLQETGAIKDLRLQVPFELIPSQRKDGRVVERSIKYVADFVYIDAETGEQIVEDVKGYRGGGAYAVFKIKKKLMLYFHGVQVKEI